MCDSSFISFFNFHIFGVCFLSQLPGRKQTASLEASGVGSGSLVSAQNFLQDSLIRVSALQNLETPGAQDLLEFTIRLKPLISYTYIILKGLSS